MTIKHDQKGGFPRIDTTLSQDDEKLNQAARLTVARRAKNVEDLALLLDMLGILPGQDEPLNIEQRKHRNDEIKLERKRVLRRIRDKKKKDPYVDLTSEEQALLDSA